MFERWEYEIPKNTAEADKVEEEVEISLGVITAVEVGFPAGCGGYDWSTNESVSLARTRLRRGRDAIAPRSPAGYLAADDFVIRIEPMLFPVLLGDPILTWELWNLDDTYPHELWLGINWLTRDELEAQLDQMKALNVNLGGLAAWFRAFFALPGGRL
jgi:hypothetical protein